MEVKEAIYKRRSIRCYEERLVTENDLLEVLEAGMQAPSASNLQPWYFVAVFSSEAMEDLKQVMVKVSSDIEPELKERFSKHPEVVKETTKFVSSLGNAPVCILAFQYKQDYPNKAKSVMQSVAAAIENISIAAVSKGLGSCWLTAPIETEMAEELRNIYAPDKGKLVAVVTLGYPAKEPKAPSRKEGRYIII